MRPESRPGRSRGGAYSDQLAVLLVVDPGWVGDSCRAITSPEEGAQLGPAQPDHHHRALLRARWAPLPESIVSAERARQTQAGPEPIHSPGFAIVLGEDHGRLGRPREDCGHLVRERRPANRLADI